MRDISHKVNVGEKESERLRHELSGAKEQIAINKENGMMKFDKIKEKCTLIVSEKEETNKLELEKEREAKEK